MRLIRWNKDLYLPGIDLWLDSKRVRDFAFVSHAHSDHIARHKNILCTAATRDLASLRLKNSRYTVLEFGQTFALQDYLLTLHPAGHILGSAQISIEKNKTRLVYTGDFRPGSSKTVESFEAVECDILIMETTFGKPHYTMPAREEVEARLLELCTKIIKQGNIPVIFAYTLGKGQEVLKLLGDAGFYVAVDRTIARFVPIYQKYGVQFAPFKLFNRSQIRCGEVVILPAHHRYQRFLKNDSRLITIYLSGWAMDSGSRDRFAVDHVLPFSDHADYKQLISLVEKLNPDLIYCTHGFGHFVEELRAAGFRAALCDELSEEYHGTAF